MKMKCAVDALKSNCCGCMACVSMCPSHAIKIASDNGFSTPVVDRNTCTDCGLCAKTCPVIHADTVKSDKRPIAAMLVKNKNIEERKRSTSGGVFFPFATAIIRGGYHLWGSLSAEPDGCTQCRGGYGQLLETARIEICTE